MKVNVMKSGNMLWMEIPKPIASMVNLEEGSTLQIEPKGLGKFVATTSVN